MADPVHTDDAPEAVGAYSQAKATADLVFTAGQIPLTPDGDLRADASIETQTRLALDNLVAVLKTAGAGPADVLKTTVYLADIDDFDAMNAAYAEYFETAPPARSAVQAGALPKGVGVEIEAVASRE
ncbi:Rid family detoxifying hydrolase [Halorubrum sp. SY-15]|uniref:Rid family detoxifying hydrolase n=1 Tax=Halorubrum sp. SY-15 TaxID=3402277 RepID=UPI003EB7D1F2